MLYNEELERFVHGERLKVVRAQVRGVPNPACMAHTDGCMHVCVAVVDVRGTPVVQSSNAQHTQVYDRLQDPCFLAQDNGKSTSTSTNKGAVPTPKPQQEANTGQWISEGVRAPPSSAVSAAPSSSPPPSLSEGAVSFGSACTWKASL